MQKIDRTRIIFIAIVGLALMIVCAAVAYNIISNLIADASATPTPVPIAWIPRPVRLLPI